MSKKLTPDQVAQYERDGYVCPIDAFTPQQARAWRAKLAEEKIARAVHH